MKHLGEPFDDWKVSFLAWIHDHTIKHTVYEEILPYFASIRDIGSLPGDLAPETADFICTFLPSVVSAILESSNQSSHRNRTFGTLLHEISILLPTVLHNKHFPFLVVIRKLLSDCLFYTSTRRTIGTGDMTSPYRQDVARQLARTETLREISALFKDSTPLPLEAFETLVWMIAQAGSYCSNPSLPSLVVDAGISRFATLIESAKDVREIDDVTFLDLYHTLHQAATSPGSVTRLVRIWVGLNVRFATSGILNKQLHALAHIRKLFSTPPPTPSQICESLQSLHFLELVLKNGIHEQLLNDLSVILRQMAKSYTVNADDVRALWTLAVHQHASVITGFTRFLADFVDSLSSQPRTALFEIIIKEDYFSRDVLNFLYTIRHYFSPKQRGTLFNIISRTYKTCDPADRDLHLQVVGEFLPTDPATRRDLLAAQVQNLSGECDIEYALLLISRLMGDSSHAQLKSIFNTVLAHLGTHLANPQPFLDVLERFPEHLKRKFSREHLGSILLKIDPLFASEPVIVTTFLSKLLRHMEFEKQFQMLSSICEREVIQPEVFAFLWKLYKTMNQEDQTIDAPGVKELWGLFFRTEDESLGDLLKSIYIQSQNPHFARLFFDQCLTKIGSKIVLKTMHDFMDCFEGLMGLKQAEMQVNRFVCEEEFISVSFAGELLESLSVLSDSSYDRILANVAFLQHCCPEAVCLRLNGVELTRRNFELKDGMTIYVECNVSSSTISLEDCENPTDVLLDPKYSEPLMAVLASGDDEIGQHALELLNAVPQQFLHTEKLFTSDWTCFYKTSQKWLLLYDLHSLGNLVKAGEKDWLEPFCSGGGADLFLEFAFLKAHQLFEVKHLLPILRMAVLLLTKLPPRHRPPFDKKRLVKVASQLNDPRLLGPYLHLFEALSTRKLATDPQFVRMLRNLFFCQDVRLRLNSLKLLERVSDDNRRTILLSSLDDVFVVNSLEYFQALAHFVRKAKSRNDLAGEITRRVFERFTLPPTDPLARLSAKVPPCNAYTGVFLVLQHLPPPPNEVSRLYKFIVKNFLLNDSKYYEPCPGLFAVLLSLLKGQQNLMAKFLSRLSKATTPNGQLPLVEPASDPEFRGLRNLGATCYMNATIQQLYSIREFRTFVLNAVPKPDDWFTEFQYLLHELRFFPSRYVDPSHFTSKWCGWNGQPIDIHEQADAVEFLQMLFERLEIAFPGSTDIFKGKIKSERIDSLPTIEEFITFPLEVKRHSNMKESISAFLENDRAGDQPGAHLTSRICSCPDVLIIHLKRFEFNLSTNLREKIDDKFVFPFSFDIAPATDTPEMSQQYDLIGVCVHSGTAQGGHYFSHVRVESEKWMTFNDITVRSCDRDSLIEQCSGGWQLVNTNDESGNVTQERLMSTTSAYLLFYRKRSVKAYQAAESPDHTIIRRLARDIKVFLIRSLFANTGFQAFLFQLSEFEIAWNFLFKDITNMFRQTSGNTLSSFVEMVSQQLPKHIKMAEFVLTRINEYLEFSLLSSSLSIRTQYHSIIIKALEVVNCAAKSTFSDAILRQFEENEEVLNHWSNLDSFLRPLLSCDVSAAWSRPLLQFLTVSLPTYVNDHPRERVYRLINLSVIFEVFVRLEQPPRALIDNDFIVNFFESSAHSASFSNMLNIAVKHGHFTINPDSQPLIRALFFISAVSLNDSSSSSRVKAFSKSLKNLSQDEQMLIWEKVTSRHPDSNANFTASFFTNCRSILKKCFLHKDEIFRSRLYSFLTELIDNCPENISVIVFASLAKLLPTISSSIRSKLTADRSTGSIPLPIVNAWTPLRTLVRQYRDLLKPSICDCANSFVLFMKDLNHCSTAQAEIFNFIMENVGDQPDGFFQHTNYADFLSVIRPLACFNMWGFLSQILNFMPHNGINHFFASKLFRDFSREILLAREKPAVHLFTDFVINRLNQSNFKSITSFLWDSDFFPKSAQRISYDTLSFFRVTWAILEQCPASVESFYNAKRHAWLWHQLNSRSVSVSQLKLFAYTLSLFNQSCARVNRKTTERVKPKAKRLMKSYENFPEFHSLFEWLRKYDHMNIYEDAFCRLVASFANLTKDLADQAFECLANCGFPLLLRVPSNIRPLIPAFVRDICHYYTTLVNQSPKIVRSVLDRELRAVIEAPLIEFRTLNPLANAILEIAPQGFDEARELINSLCLAAKNFVIFHDDVLKLVIAVGDPRSALEWMKHFWNLLIRSITPASRSYKRDAVKNAIETVNASRELINGLTERYNLSMDAILPHKKVFRDFAVILQRPGVDESGTALMVVMEWLTKIE